MKKWTLKKPDTLQLHKKKYLVREKREFLSAMLFLLPSLLGVCYFVLFPLGDAVRRSFFDAMGNHFVGSENYKSVFKNTAFQLAAANTARFIGVCIPVLIALSLVIALLTRKTIFGKDFFKTSFLLPMVIPVASMVVLWRLFFSKQGLLNLLLSQTNIIPQDWMNTKYSFYILVFSYIWRNLGYDVILWLAGLSAIPLELYEAAQVDGAGAFCCFWNITIPQLYPSLFVISVLSILNSFKVFREAYLIAGSHPNDAIYMLQHLFSNWFANLDLQKLCAAAVVVAAVIMTLILILQIAWEKEDS